MKGSIYIPDHIDIDSIYAVMYSIWRMLSFVNTLK